MLDESEFFDINAEIKIFKNMLKEDGYKEEKIMENNTQKNNSRFSTRRRKYYRK